MRVFELKRVSLIFAITVCFFIPIKVHAINAPLNLETSPEPILLTAKPGSHLTTDLSIKNNSKTSETLRVNLLKVSQDSQGQVKLTNPQPNDPTISWVSFSKTVFPAPPGQTQTIKMTIDIPETAGFGYYYAVEFMRSTALEAQLGYTVTDGAIARFVLLNVEVPGAKREAKIENFKTDHNYYEFLPVGFSVKVKSSGNIHVAPYGNIFISKGSTQLFQIKINEFQSNILPGASTTFEGSWNDGFPHYELKYGKAATPNATPKITGKNLKWNFSEVSKLRFGKYTAHVVLVYDNGQRDVPLESTISFWVIPVRVVLLVIAIIALIAALITYVVVLRRKLKRLSSSNKKDSNS